MLNQIKNGTWRVDIQPGGRNSRRYRKTFATKGEALRFQSLIEKKHAEGLEWNPEGADKRSLSDLTHLWHQQVGIHLKDGERRKNAVIRAAKAMSDPPAAKLTAQHYLTYRQNRKRYQETGTDSVSPKTHNNELAYISSIYNHLSKTDQIKYPNPLRNVKPIRIDETELSFLEADQIIELFAAIKSNATNPHVYLIAEICLATAARWGEAEGLHSNQVKNNSITYINTKTRKNRTVPIDSDLYKRVKSHGEGKLFTSSLGAFRRALAKTSIELPKGQASHVLRHTYASHFMMRGGDILTLQKIMGHSKIDMTMRYAHLSPGHLAQAVEFSAHDFLS